MSIQWLYSLHCVNYHGKLTIVHSKGKGKDKGVCKLLMELHLTTTECRLPYGITHTGFHPTQANTPRLYPSQTGWYSIYRPFKDGGLSKQYLL